MTPDPDATTTQNRLCNDALNAEQRGRLAEAVALYRRAIDCDPRNATPYLFFGYALARRGDAEAAVQAWSLGADLDSRFINAWNTDDVDPLVGERSKAAHDAIRAHFSALHRRCIEQFKADHAGADVSRIAAAIWCQTHDKAFDYGHPDQRPHLFYVPHLAPIPVYSDEHASWFASVEDAWADIRDEFLAAQRVAGSEQAPYLDAGAAQLGTAWVPIANSLNWGSFHLYKQGKPNQRLIQLCPRTLEVLAGAPLVQTPSGPSEVLFSVLQGGQRIPPHFGVANTDMTVHLPLICPGDAAIRVVDTVYEWRPGKVFAFDDAFRHESWNRSSEPRVNLLFEAWHPDLSDVEQRAVMATFQARLQWNASRSLDHGGR